MFASPEDATAPVGSVQGQAPRRVLGIDPGMTRCGYAVLESDAPSHVRPVSLGVLRTDAKDPTAIRLGQLCADIQELLVEFRPSALALEQVFFQINVRTAMSVGQVSGLAMALAANLGCQVVEYTPNQVKESVTGWGAADKAQVQKMVQARLGLSRPPEPVDASDAAAVALCFLASAPLHNHLVAAGAQLVHGRVRAR